MKPDVWQDEKVGELSHSARLTLLGLITLADDEGRLVGRPALIIGHAFPWDDEVTPARLERWLEEIEAQGIVLRYEHEGRPYIAFRHWRRHQKINRATPSTLPPPPDSEVVDANGVNAHDGLTDDSVNRGGEGKELSSPRAQARVPTPSPDPDPIPSEESELVARVLAVLNETADAAGASHPGQTAVARAMADFPDRDHVAVAAELRFKVADGLEVKQVARKYRAFLEQADAVPFYRRTEGRSPLVDDPEGRAGRDLGDGLNGWKTWAEEHFADESESMRMQYALAAKRIDDAGLSTTVETVRARVESRFVEA